MPIDYSHQHLSTSIMQVSAPHTPIDPSGGGGVSVDNGTDPPAAVTTLVAPGANVSTPGQATLVATRLLGPFVLTPSTANLVNADDNGFLLASVSAGSAVRAMAFNRIAWNATSPAIVVAIAGAIDSGSSTMIGNMEVDALPNGAADGALVESLALDPTVFAFATEACGIYAVIYTASGTPTVGQTDVYLLVATPVS